MPVKKIVFYINGWMTGGIENTLFSILKYIEKFEHIECTVKICKGKKIARENFPKFVKVEEISKSRKLIVLLKKTILKCKKHNIGLMRKLEQIMNCYPSDSKIYDIAVEFQQMPHFLIPYVIKKVRAKKKILWIHEDLSNKTFLDNQFRKYIDEYDDIVSVSDVARLSLFKHYPDMKKDVTVIHNLINVDKIIKLSKEKDTIYDSNSINICSVGRLIRDKGFEIAIEACKILIDRGYKIKWYVCGEGSYRKILEDKIDKYNLKENFILLGNQLNPYKYMKQAYIYCQPSLQEGYCNTLAEAKLLKKAIIATNFDAVHEHIKNGYNGLIVEISGVSLANGIEKLITDKQKYNMILQKSEYSENEQIQRRLYSLFQINE